MSAADKSPGDTSASSLSPPSLFCALGGEDVELSDDEMRNKLFEFLSLVSSKTRKIEGSSSPPCDTTSRKVLIIPPDYTRFHSQAGKITQWIHEFLETSQSTGESATDGDEAREKDAATTEITVLPALGTHAPMTQTQIASMFGDALAKKEPSPFVVHDWRKDVVTIGYAPSDMVRDATNGMVNTPWPAQLNRLVWDGDFDLILSVGQVVPHEVMGMANFNKNLFVGTGGVDAINLSHFIGAVYGMERMMGRADNPLRRILNYASEKFLETKLPLWYILTVVGTDEDTGQLKVKGFYIGNDIQCYLQACELSLKVNFSLLDHPLKKVVVYLDPDEFHSTWLGNKAIYRTRMALADSGRLIILAPGLTRFGEDDAVDALIRKYGYRGTSATLKALDNNEDLKENLSAAAHLIHGSTEGRFHVTYCPGHLSKEEIEGVGFDFDDLEVMQQRYDVDKLKDGWNTLHGEEFYFIRNPAMGLWAVRGKFEEQDENQDCDGKSKKKMKPAVTQVEPQNETDGSGGVGGWAKAPQR